MSDVRVNSRSPYFIEANRAAPEPIVVPPPVEENTPPTVTILASNEYPTIGETVTLTAIAVDTDGTIVSYEWIGGSVDGQTTISVDITNSTTVESQTYSVVVTDDDGDTASASVTIHWQAVVQQPPVITDVYCGDVVNEGTWVGTKVYNLVGVGDKIGEVKIQFLQGIETVQDVPINFFLEWDGNTSTTGYIGDSSFDDDVLAYGVLPTDLNTASPTNKTSPTSLILNKTSATPTDVTLTAISAFANDSYSFRLICPEPPPTQTYYYTLKSTCTSGTSEFSYTDINGNPQTVILSNGETQIVSAQENSVSVEVCTGNVTQGGQSFDNGVPELTIDSNSEFNIWLDNSGSLNSELDEIIIMVNNELKSSFISYYNNDQALYDSNVRSINGSLFLAERFLYWASKDGLNPGTNKTVNIIYIDESNDSYHGSVVGDNFMTTKYSSDLNRLRNDLDSQSIYGGKLVIVFCIEKTTSNQYKQFSHFIDNISNGVNGFDGANGLSDRSEVIFVRNVLPLQNSAYYHQITIQTLQSLGYKIS